MTYNVGSRNLSLDSFDIHWLPVIWSPDIRSFQLYGQFLVGPDFPILKIIGYMVKISVIWSKWSDILMKLKAKAIESGVI